MLMIRRQMQRIVLYTFSSKSVLSRHRLRHRQRQTENGRMSSFVMDLGAAEQVVFMGGLSADPWSPKHPTALRARRHRVRTRRFGHETCRGRD